jgi:phosphate transport system substrate-binding protein
MKERQETTTKGSASIIVDEEIAPLMEKERIEFLDLYQQARFHVDMARAREAVVQFFNVDTIKAVAISRPLNFEEREVAKRANLSFGEYKIAFNGLAVIVNNGNSVEELRTTELDSIYTGRETTWKYSGATIQVCLPNENSAAFEIMATRVLNGARYAAPAAIAKSSQDMIDYVSNHKEALGMVSVNWLTDNTDRVKVLRLHDPAAPDSIEEKDKYYTPHQAYLYEHAYPLTTDVYIYSRADIYSVATGLISFISSVPGQQIVINSGLAPATMPVRLVQTSQKDLTQ